MNPENPTPQDHPLTGEAVAVSSAAPQTYGDIPAVEETVFHTFATDPARAIRARFAFASGDFGLVSKAADPFRWTYETAGNKRRAGTCTSIEDGLKEICASAEIKDDLVLATVSFSDGGRVVLHRWGETEDDGTAGYEWAAQDRTGEEFFENQDFEATEEQALRAAIVGYVSMVNATHTPELSVVDLPAGEAS